MKYPFFAAILLCSASIAAHAAEAPKFCEEYFKEIDNFASENPQAAAMYKQAADKMKEAYNQSIQIAGASAAESYESGCEIALRHFKAAYKP